MLLLRLAFQLAIGEAHGHAAALSAPESLVVRTRADSTIGAFFSEWQSAWAATQRERPKERSGEDLRTPTERSWSLHCHWASPSSPALTWLSRYMIGSGTAQRSCPRWYPADAAPLADERVSIDNGLNRGERLWITALRQRLRATLDSAARRLPGDVHLAEQRVRFAIEAGDVAGAAQAAVDCTGDEVRCALLQGLVLYRAGAVASADSAFVATTRLMSDSARCAWDDVGFLLDREGRRAYAAASCAQRAEYNARLWWLTDPLWLEPGNERRAEQNARKELVTIIASLGKDARQYFTPREGGAAVIETLLRYGWPSQMWWGGVAEDLSHTQWLDTMGAAPAAPYVVREYTRGRLHTVPVWSAIEDPFHAQAGAWQLNAPDGDREWWPAEHYARDAGGIEQLPIGQTAMFRRRASARFAWAGDADSVAQRCAADRMCSASLVASTRVGEVRAVSSSPVRSDKPILVDGLLDAGPTLVAIELPGAVHRPAARTRFAAMIADPLSTLHGERALSDPVLFDPADAPARIDDDEALRRMFGSTTFTTARRIGIYWEAYDYRATDTVDVEVRITNQNHENVAERLFHVFRAGEAGASVGVHWREVPGNMNALVRTDGNVPIQMRSIVLDLSKLSPGTYDMALSMKPIGGVSQSIRRSFALR